MLYAYLAHNARLNQDSTSRNQRHIIFVAHSMGGLVVKEAFIIGHRNPVFKQIVDRISMILFLATPHRGSNMAQMLNRLGAVLPGQRPFVESLIPGSERLQAINEDFTKYCGDIRLRSFFETMPMKVTRIIIVEK